MAPGVAVVVPVGGDRAGILVVPVGVVVFPVEGSVAEEVRGVGSTVAGAVLGTSAQGVAGSHSVATVPGMAEQ